MNKQTRDSRTFCPGVHSPSDSDVTLSTEATALALREELELRCKWFGVAVQYWTVHLLLYLRLRYSLYISKIQKMY